MAILNRGSFFRKRVLHVDAILTSSPSLFYRGKSNSCSAPTCTPQIIQHHPGMTQRLLRKLCSISHSSTGTRRRVYLKKVNGRYSHKGNLSWGTDYSHFHKLEGSSDMRRVKRTPRSAHQLQEAAVYCVILCLGNADQTLLPSSFFPR